jgi:hypothetical protein
MASQQRVSVAIRVRPVLKSGGSAVHQMEKLQLMAVRKLGDGGIVVEEQRPGTVCRSQQFTFDQVFDGDTNQLELYEDAVVDLIDGALVGNNATILAYGQTGSGKTHTILGDVRPNPLEDDLLTANSGVFLRVLSDLLEYRQRKAKDTWVVVGLSCIEIYNDKIRDLFGGTMNEPAPDLKVAMIGDTVLTPGLTTKEVTSMMSVFSEIQLAIGRRQMRATEANAVSSRSHCIFQIDILQLPKKNAASPPPLDIIGAHFHKIASGSGAAGAPGGGAAGGAAAATATSPKLEGWAGTTIKVPGQKDAVARFSRILVCDLAGSEKLDRSMAVGQAAKEATQINMSLTALGNVVHALHQGEAHVKYRDSSLTRLLMPAFSQDSSRVLLLAHCSPTQLTYDESVSSLHFANKVKAVRIATTMNEVDNTVPDFLAVVLRHDMLTAELRIFRADSGARPVSTRSGASLLAANAAGTAKWRCVPPAIVPGETERIQQLDANGGLRAGRAMVDEVKAAERAEYDALVAKVPEIVQSYAASHKARMRAARDSVAKHRAAGLPFIEELAETTYLSLVDEAEAAFAEFEGAAARGVLAVLQRRDAATMAELARLRAVVLPKLQLDPVFVATTAAEDERYAMACAAHCNGRRFLNAFLEYREQHAALLVAASNVAAAQAWLAKQPRRQEKAAAAADVEV